MDEEVLKESASERREEKIYEIFEIAIVLKGLNAILEIGLGVLLLFTNIVNDVVIALAHLDFIEDPDGFFARHVHALTPISPHAQLFGSLYLLSHGVVKVLLMTGLWRKKLWAYPSTIVVLLLFVCYQLIRFLGTHSPGLIFLSVFDLLVVWLVWHEYKRFPRGGV